MKFSTRDLILKVLKDNGPSLLSQMMSQIEIEWRHLDPDKRPKLARINTYLVERIAQRMVLKGALTRVLDKDETRYCYSLPLHPYYTEPDDSSTKLVRRSHGYRDVIISKYMTEGEATICRNALNVTERATMTMRDLLAQVELAGDAFANLTRVHPNGYKETASLVFNEFGWTVKLNVRNKAARGRGSRLYLTVDGHGRHVILLLFMRAQKMVSRSRNCFMASSGVPPRARRSPSRRQPGADGRQAPRYSGQPCWRSSIASAPCSSTRSVRLIGQSSRLAAG